MSLVLLIVAFIFIVMALNESLDAAERWVDAGQLCLATLTLKDYTTANSDNFHTISTRVQLIQDQCSTNNNLLEIKRENVVKPRDEEENQKQALMKKVADRMAYIWYMTGAGTIDSLWDDNTFFKYWVGQNDEMAEWACINFMNFKIVPTEYTKSISSYELMSYLRDTTYRSFNIDGKKQLMTYYEYMTMYAGVGSGGIMIAPNSELKAGEEYSIAIARLPKDVNNFLSVSAISCGVAVAGFAIGSISAKAAAASGTAATVATAGTAGVGAVSYAVPATFAVFSLAGYTAGILGSIGCGSTIGNNVGEEMKLSSAIEHVDYFSQAETQAILKGKASTELYKKIDYEADNTGGSFIIIGKKDVLTNMGCVEIHSGDKPDDTKIASLVEKK